MRKEPSRAEHLLWKILRDRRLENWKFRRQHPIERYIADFACVKAKLIVEVDGPSHSITNQIAYDAVRTARLEALGWRLLRLTNDLVLSDERRAMALIVDALNNSPSPRPSPPTPLGERE